MLIASFEHGATPQSTELMNNNDKLGIARKEELKNKCIVKKIGLKNNARERLISKIEDNDKGHSYRPPKKTQTKQF